MVRHAAPNPATPAKLATPDLKRSGLVDLVIKGKYPAPVDQGAVGREWAERGFDCRLFVNPPGREWNGFVHAANELVTVVEGVMLCTVEIGTVEKETIRLEMGDELFIPRNAVHSVKNIHSGMTRWLFGYD
jgi:quercetin dioxygenase-like cupin family protein